VPSYTWFILGLAIVTEVIATSSLKLSDGFTRLWPSVVVVVAYGISFYCLALTMKTLPIGIIYAAWSGLGIVLVTLVGWFFFKQHLDIPALIGMALIIAGVVIMNVWSKVATVVH